MIQSHPQFSSTVRLSSPTLLTFKLPRWPTKSVIMPTMRTYLEAPAITKLYLAASSQTGWFVYGVFSMAYGMTALNTTVKSIARFSDCAKMSPSFSGVLPGGIKFSCRDLVAHDLSIDKSASAARNGRITDSLVFKSLL
jgi:hypothetical protein